MAGTPTRSAKSGRPTLAWDEELDNLYRAWQRRIAAVELGHRKLSDRLQRRYLMLGLPVVVLTTVIGTAVFASLADEEPVDTATRVIVGSVSITAAVLSSLQTFLRYATRAEGHRVAAIRYETLRRDVAETLALPLAMRNDPIRELDSVRLRMDRYAKESPPIAQREWERLEKQFHLSPVPPDPPWRGAVRIPESPPSRDAASPGEEAAAARDDG